MHDVASFGTTPNRLRLLGHLRLAHLIYGSAATIWKANSAQDALLGCVYTSLERLGWVQLGCN